MWVYVLFGNRTEGTARIARAIATAVDWSNEDRARAAAEVDPAAIRSPGVIFLGCAAGGSELDRSIRRFLDRLSPRTFYSSSFAVFDTRTDPVPRVAGSGVRRLRRAVVHRGGRLVSPGESFYTPSGADRVPSAELDRARTWGYGTIATAVRQFHDPEVRSGVLSIEVRHEPWGIPTLVAP